MDAMTMEFLDKLPIMSDERINECLDLARRCRIMPNGELRDLPERLAIQERVLLAEKETRRLAQLDERAPD